MAKMVHTVLGPMPIEQLGVTLMHEHLVFGPENDPAWSPPPNRAALLEALVAELQIVRRSHGLSCFVDLTPIGCSRDVTLARAVAQGANVAIVCCTGFWEGTSYPEWVALATIAEITQQLVRELEEGINGTDIRAGVIKVATGPGGIGRTEANVLRAAARAHKRVGAPIITHTSLGAMGWEQLAIFEQEGCDLSRVVIGHLDSQTDLEYFRFILQRGACVAFDRIGRGPPTQPPDTIKADLVAALVKEGWAERLILSHDAARWFTMQGGYRPERPPYSYLFATFREMLLQRGVTHDEIMIMLVHTPARILGW